MPLDVLLPAPKLPRLYRLQVRPQGRLLDIVHVKNVARALLNRPACAGNIEISQVPVKERLHVHRVSDCARYHTNSPIAFARFLSSASLKNINTSLLITFAAQYLAHGLPCQHFTSALTNSRA